MISENDKKFLLMLARETLKACVKTHQPPSPASLGITLSPALQEPRGAFVTVYAQHAKEKTLRGCIGTILPRYPLHQAVINNTIAAATQDPRFSRVTEEELSNVALEIRAFSLKL